MTRSARFDVFKRRRKAERAFIRSALNDLIDALERAAADKQDILCVNLDKFLLRVLASALRRDISDRALQNLEQRLLHALAGDVARDGRVLALA